MIRFVLSLLLLAACVGVFAQAPSLDEVRRLVREGRLNDAMTAIDTRLAAYPHDRHTRFLKGVVLAEQRRDDAAIEVFKGLTRDYPELPEPYNNLAVLYARRDDFEAARDALLQAINTHPSYATAHENLGDIYAKMAGVAYSRALSLDTANSAAKQKLALIDDLFIGDAPDPVVVAGLSTTPQAPRPLSAPPPMPVPAPVSKPARALSEPPPISAAPAPVSTPPRASAPPAATTAPPTPVAEPAETAPAAPVAARAPAATKPSPPPASLDELVRDEAIATVRSWASAWSRQDVDGYLGHYLAAKSPEPGMSRPVWEARRRDRLTRPAFIELEIDDLQVRRAGPSRLEVTFVQAYRSNTYADRVRKRLTLERSGGEWKISEERSLAKL